MDEVERLIRDRIDELAAKLKRERDLVGNEDGAKNAFIMPFLSKVLGYDVFDPEHVAPELQTGNGPVDYALVRDGVVQMIVEAKKLDGKSLGSERVHQQLSRYFSATSARVGALTDGQVWRFYADLDVPETLDARPFLEIDLGNVDEDAVVALCGLTRESFNRESVFVAARQLKFVADLRRSLAERHRWVPPELAELAMRCRTAPPAWIQFAMGYREQPDAWVRSHAQSIGPPHPDWGRDQYRPLVAKAAHQFLNDLARRN